MTKYLKEKSILKELTKNYMLIISIVVILYIFPIFAIAKYHYSYTREEMYNVEEFFEIEFSEPEHKNLDYFLSELVRESPEITGLSLVITHGDHVFKDRTPPELGELPFRDKIQYYGLKYWVINKNIQTKYNGVVQVRIIKELSPLILFFKNLILISAMALMTLIFTCFFIMKKFFSSFTTQLTEIKKISDKITLTSFEIDINSNNFYEEFSLILTSYEKMLKRLKHQSDIQIDFVNSASHELKTPIFIIKNYLTLLKKYSDSNKELFYESLDSVNEEVLYTEKLIEKLLFLSKDNQQQNIIKEQNNLSEIVSDVIQEMEILHPNQLISFEKKHIIFDTNWILCKQVIRNIIDNAIKYGNSAPISIFISCSKKYTIVYIYDKGKGIPKDALPFIFNKFYRVEKNSSFEGKGYGLGLAIVKSIMKSLNGKIFISSKLEEGTVVKLIFSN